jgi:hypothetical protein
MQAIEPDAQRRRHRHALRRAIVTRRRQHFRRFIDAAGARTEPLYIWFDLFPGHVGVKVILKSPSARSQYS